jgi:hypothetical protein
MSFSPKERSYLEALRIFGSYVAPTWNLLYVLSSQSSHHRHSDYSHNPYLSAILDTLSSIRNFAIVYIKPFTDPISILLGLLIAMSSIHVWRNPKARLDRYTKMYMGCFVILYLWGFAGRVAGLDTGIPGWLFWGERGLLGALLVVETVGLRWEAGFLDEGNETVVAAMARIPEGTPASLEQGKEKEMVVTKVPSST